MSKATAPSRAPSSLGCRNGGFAISWTDTSRLGLDTSGNAARIRLFDAAGNATSDEFLAHNVTLGDQYATGLAASGDGFTALVGRSQRPGRRRQRIERQVPALRAQPGDRRWRHHLGHRRRRRHPRPRRRRRLNGLGGGDVLFGGDGGDTLDGGDDTDMIDGEAGDDILSGGTSGDSLVGGTGADNLSGGDGADQLLGGDDDDMLDGGGDADLLDGGAGNDVVNAGIGDDRLLHNAVAGAAGWDFTNGSAGIDTLVADYGSLAVAVTMAAPTPDGFGGYSGSLTAAGHQLSFTAIETLNITGGSARRHPHRGRRERRAGRPGRRRPPRRRQRHRLPRWRHRHRHHGRRRRRRHLLCRCRRRPGQRSADAGIDTLWTSRSLTLGANLENLRGIATGSSGLTLTGNGGDNLIAGTTKGDWIDGGGGADRMEGGAGSDTYIVDHVGDVIYDDDFDPSWPFIIPIDVARVSITTFSLVGTGVNDVVGLLTTGHVLTGHGGSNRLTGNAGDDRLDGGAGRDTMIGGAGNDTYVVDHAAEQIQEAAGGGTDEALVGVSHYELPSEVENATLTIVGSTTLYGNAGANVLRGTDGDETFDGRGGADTMIGGLGGDTYYVDNAGDVVVEAPGDVSFWSDKIYTSLAYYENAVGVELLEGTAARQTLVGNAGNEWLISAGGGDTLIGGGGNDLYVVSAGDVVVEQVDEGVDLVRTEQGSYTLGDNVEELQGTSFSILADADRQCAEQPHHRHPAQQSERHDRRRPRRRHHDRLARQRHLLCRQCWRLDRRGIAPRHRRRGPHHAGRLHARDQCREADRPAERPGRASPATASPTSSPAAPATTR